MKTIRKFNKFELTIRFESLQSYIEHGFFNETNYLIGYNYQDQRKGFWLEKNI